MNWFVQRLGALVSRFPATVVIAIGAISVVLGLLATQQQFEADITGFVPEGELQRLDERIDQEFGAGERRSQVIVDAGPGGDVLSSEGVAVAERLEAAIRDHPDVAEVLHEGGPMAGQAVLTYATPIAAQLQQLDIDPAEASDAFVDAARDDALSGQQSQRITALLSQDFDGERARGGLVVVNLDPDADQEAIRRAHLAIDEAVGGVDPGFHDADAFSFALVQQEMEGGMQQDMPRLLGMSFLLIIAVLAVQFRRASDVLLGILGLGLSIVWMAGISVLLGPDYLGITGNFSQVAMAVPVLLVGLGIDYSVHLTSRYREERAAGAAPVPSARTAVVTVGVALALATLTTAIGFLSNVVSPLPPIADFGLFAAAGIVAAAVVLGLLVPAGRILLDRRRAATTEAAHASPERRGLLSWLPAHAPGTTLAAGLLVAMVAGLLATGLDTTFSEEEFIPADSDAAVMFDRLEELFGGDVSERTQALVDADVAEPAAFTALLDAEEQLAEVEGVRTVDGRAEASSPASVVRQLAETADAMRRQLAAQFALLDDPAAGLERLPLPEELTYDDLPAAMQEQIDQEQGLPAGDQQLPIDDLSALEERLPPGVSAAEALLASLPDAELVDTFRAGIAEQVEEDAPQVPDDVVARLASLEADELTAERIEETGYPTEELPEQALTLITAGDRLAELGWTEDGVADDADVDGLLAVAEEHVGDQLDRVYSGDAALVDVGTQAGEDGAARVAQDIERTLQPVASAAGGAVAVVSEQLLLDVTLQQMTDSQIEAIVVSLLAALVLLTVYYALATRRPLLGPITMLPSLLSVPLILGSMWAVGLSFNALTATVSSIAIGIGVPYGIHVTNRFLEQRAAGESTDITIGETLRHTGAALVGSAVTTASGFGVLVLSDLTPLRQFGGVTSVTILYALVAALFIESSALVLWDRWHRRRSRHADEASTAGVEPGSSGEAAGPLVHREGEVPG